MAQHAPPGKSPARCGPARWGIVTALLVVSIAGALWVPVYARSLPKLGPFPFFYWYQFVWIPVAAVLCGICYLLLRTKRPSQAEPAHGEGTRT